MRRDAQLLDVWRYWAHRATDTHLVVTVVASIVAVAVFAVAGAVAASWAMRWWPTVLVPVFAGAFGTWAIADREVADRARRGAGGARVWAALKLASSVVAAAAALAAVFVFLHVTIGTWIS